VVEERPLLLLLTGEAISVLEVDHEENEKLPNHSRCNPQQQFSAIPKVLSPSQLFTGEVMTSRRMTQEALQ
jgi:hypothetical protein